MSLKLVSPAEPATPGAAEPTSEYRYWAFLSYSHHDKAIAKRLQKQLETYRVPKRLVGRETSHGVVPPRVSPVFRDRDELHAGSDLKASVHEALSHSRWLIVVCTPDSARSPWVNREIVEFKKLHGERRVLALIARGEPFASDMAGREAEECFPPALRRALTDEGKAEGEPLEPIAADMRKHGDGPHRSMLKLLAGMLGVPFDDLVRRDLQRRVRWLSVLAASSALGVVVFACLAVVAVQARNEAQYQRQQAEGLIEFMLGDLRKKLEPVGRLEVLDSVGEKTLGYYGGQDAAALDANALGHRSRAMHLIGEIRDLRGQPAEAQRAFEQAAETTALLLSKAPNDGQRIFDHAQSVYWVGYAAWKRADGRNAEARFLEYLGLAQRLTQIDPANPAWLAEGAHARINLGVVQLGMGRANAAVTTFQAAGELFGALLPRRPELGLDLANSHGWLAKSYAAQGAHDKALDWLRRRIDVLRAVPDSGRSRTVQREIMLAHLEIAHQELSLGRLSQSAANVALAVGMADELVKTDADNFSWQLDACVAKLHQVEIALLQRQLDQAVRESPTISGCIEKVGAGDSTGVWDTVLLKARAFTVLLALPEDRRRAESAARLREFLATSAVTVQKDMLDRASLDAGLAAAYIALGDHDLKVSGSDARASWNAAVRLLEPHAATGDGFVLTTLAQARLRLNDAEGARRLVARIEPTIYRHPAFAELLNQLHAARGTGGLSVPLGAKK